MLSLVCKELKNWFCKEKFFGKFEIKDGYILFADGTEIGLIEGQYFRIIGSILNDGVYQFPTTTNELQPETFEGAVWALAIPREVVDLSNEIDEWQEKYGGVESEAMSPYVSESFGGYSYTKASGTGASGSGVQTWQSVFADRLKMWRKI